MLTNVKAHARREYSIGLQCEVRCLFKLLKADMYNLYARREYSIGLRCEVRRKASADDPKRAAELAAYFTHARLQPGHVVLSLRSAMTQFYKLENFATAAIFARRLLEMNAPAKVLPNNIY